ncbi:MAG: pantetheine-phosphate adenylyltransferase [Acidimicrobiaceae bacterium]|nr:pantetheine-phosphate adenylyltransferase [Acidimicrobiaceae bacterium]
MIKALYPGSFDPFHNGHVEIVERAAALYDVVVVAAMRNPQKAGPLFSLEERKEMIESAISHVHNVEVVSLSTLVVDLARALGAGVIVRGLRVVSDFEAELQMAQMNRRLSGIDTVFIPTSAEFSFLASKLLREVSSFGGDVSSMVPKVVADALNAKYGR